jgi:excisionase family DNA binding protein
MKVKDFEDVPDEVWTVRQTARYLKLSTRTVQSRIRAGRIPAIMDGLIMRLSGMAVERWQRMSAEG